MKILAIQNRMGIGDTVIFLPFIKAISKKFQVPVSLLVKENSRANEFLSYTSYIGEIIHLERDNKINQFPLFEKQGQDMIKASRELIFKKTGINVNSDPSIQVSNQKIEEASKKYDIYKNNLNIF